VQGSGASPRVCHLLVNKGLPGASYISKSSYDTCMRHNICCSLFSVVLQVNEQIPTTFGIWKQGRQEVSIPMYISIL
jgi:hypothetical protein